MGKDKRELIRALREVGASGWHWRAAGILLGVNGLANALQYVHGLVEKGLAPGPKVCQLAMDIVEE